MIRFLFSVTLYFAICFSALAQIHVVNVPLNADDISASSLCRINLMNEGSSGQIRLEISISDASGNELLSLRSSDFSVLPGLNSTDHSMIRPGELRYSPGVISQYINAHQSLPPGLFHYCCKIIQSAYHEMNDEYCEDMNVPELSQLLLISPADMDTIEATRPVFSWVHRDAARFLLPGEYYEMKCVEIPENKTAEEALMQNRCLFLTRPTEAFFAFPANASSLQEGKSYAWQIRKISGGSIVNASEIGRFAVRDNKPPAANKYVAMKKFSDGGFYYAWDNRIYFRFDEPYSSGEMRCSIYNEKREQMLPVLKNERKLNTQAAIIPKTAGANNFELSLGDMDLTKGFYTLEVSDEKNDVYVLKFCIP